MCSFTLWSRGRYRAMLQFLLFFLKYCLFFSKILFSVPRHYLTPKWSLYKSLSLHFQGIWKALETRCYENECNGNPDEQHTETLCQTPEPYFSMHRDCLDPERRNGPGGTEKLLYMNRAELQDVHTASISVWSLLNVSRNSLLGGLATLQISSPGLSVLLA